VLCLNSLSLHVQAAIVCRPRAARVAQRTVSAALSSARRFSSKSARTAAEAGHSKPRHVKLPQPRNTLKQASRPATKHAMPAAPDPKSKGSTSVAPPSRPASGAPGVRIGGVAKVKCGIQVQPLRRAPTTIVGAAATAGPCSKVTTVDCSQPKRKPTASAEARLIIAMRPRKVQQLGRQSAGFKQPICLGRAESSPAWCVLYVVDCERR
jgi:hypothetical protein